MSYHHHGSGDSLLDFFRNLRREGNATPFSFGWNFGLVLNRNNRYPATLVTAFYHAAQAVTDPALNCFDNEESREAGKRALLKKLEKWCGVSKAQVRRFDHRALSNLMGAFYALRVRPPSDFLERWAEQIPSQLRPEHHISLQEITTALADLAICPTEKVSKVLASGTQELADSLSCKAVSAHLYRLAVLDSLCPNASQSSLKQSAQGLAEQIVPRLLNTNGKRQLSVPERRQLLTVLQWFSEEGIKGIEVPRENGTASSSEQSLRRKFEVAGAVSQEPFICPQTGHKFDLSMRFNGSCARLEYDGPYHFVKGVAGGDVFYDGSTILQTRLHRKLLPEDVIVRVPYFLCDRQNGNSQMWPSAKEAISNATPGIYMLEGTGYLVPFCEVIQKPLSHIVCTM